VWGKCGADPIEHGDIVTEYYTDTTYVTHVDTVEFEKVVTVTKTRLFYKNIYNLDDSTKLFKFETHVSDSLISGDITTKLTLRDSTLNLVSQNIAYIPKFPKYIHTTDSIFIKDSTVITKYDNKVNFLLGVDAMLGEQPASVIPTVGLQFKNKSIIEFGYDPFNKQFMLGAKFKLKFKK
jgi:hypothetical protein